MAKTSSVKVPIVWETPFHPDRSKRGFYQPFADELRKHPNKWARLPLPEGKKHNYADATAVKEGRLIAFRPRGSFEALARGGVTYVRYVGETSTS